MSVTSLESAVLMLLIVSVPVHSFLPARPDKNMIESRRMTDTFIEERRAALQRYLNRLAAHPTAARSEVSNESGQYEQ